MKKLSLVIFILIFFQVTATSQSCLPEGIAFSTQADIDNFQINFPGCTEIEGDVSIDGSGIINLNGLSVLTSIGGNLIFYQNSNLTSLMGLEALTSIGGELKIYFSSLTNLTGLDALTSIGESLTIDDNNSLISLTGLNALTSIGGYVDIVWNEDLTSLTGLNALTSIGGALSFQHNEALTSLTGLDVLTSAGVIYIQYNSALTSLTGLDAVTSIGEHLVINNNDALTSLTGLNALTSIGGELYIMFNAALTSLAGIDNINSNSITNLHIYNDSSLTICEVKSICDYLASPNGIIEIHDNASGCFSKEEVEAACGIGLAENTMEGYCSIYPNPFTNETTFNIQLIEQAKIKLLVFNNMGQVIETILDESLSQGNHQVIWNAEGLQVGIYFYQLTANGQRQPATGKIVVVR